ncbi:MAG: DUF5119 domain-containing protein [Flavobacteriales bacterium]|nr:DUF5119 domain-containing protein [Flavobacteriales bacterium]
MMKKSHIIALIVICISVFSCGKRPLCYLPHPHETEINVVYDWQKLFQNTDIPSTMLLYAYSENSDDYYVFTVKSTSDKIKLPYGAYKILTIDGDIQRAMLRDMEKFETATTFSPTLSPVAKEDVTSYTLHPEMLHTATSNISSMATASTTLTLTPAPHTHQIILVVKVPDSQRVNITGAEISGMSSYSNISTGEHTRKETASHIFEIHEISSTSFSGEIFSMGVCPDIEGQQRIDKILTLRVTENASKASYSIATDVSDIANTIKDHQLTIYTEVTGSAQIGFDITVTGYKSGTDGVLIVKTQPKK